MVRRFREIGKGILSRGISKGLKRGGEKFR